MRTTLSRSLRPLVIASVLFWTTSALAQPAAVPPLDPFSLDRFVPSLPGDRFFGVEGGDPGGHALPRLLLLLDYAYRPLTLYSGSNEKRVGDVVANNLLLHLAGGVTLWDRLVLAADLPLVLVTSGGSPTIDGLTVISPSGASLGDLRASARVRLAGEARSIASVSLGLHLFLPTGDKKKLAGDGSVHAMPVLALAGENDSMAYALTLGMNLRKAGTYVTTSLGSQLAFGAAVGLLFADRALQLGPEIYGTTLMVGDDAFGRATTNVEGILGLRMRIGGLVLGAGAGPGFTHGIGTPTVRALLSLAYVPIAEKPAPPPPKKVEPADRDGDGIPDRRDACPDQPGVRDPDHLKNGCPPAPADRDEDGIPDGDDACPDIKGVRSPIPAENGCPPDTDGDGIRDDRDACPQEKGQPDSDPSKNGCPKAVRVTETEIIILEQVQFKTASAVILPVSDDLLRQVAAVLTEHPEIRKVEVQGHTDSRGGRAYNKKLSEKRSAAVKKWLVEKGQIDADRLISQGYGLDEPISDNQTDEGRQKNRRVQFKILEKTKSLKDEVTQ